jgi:hypothetical protein
MEPAIAPPPIPAEFAHLKREWIEKLMEKRDYPGIAEAFDKKFGQPKGTGAKILATYNLRPRSKQQNPYEFLRQEMRRSEERQRLENGG